MDVCYNCNCWDSDFECCTMPSVDRWYACPIESEKPENKKELERIFRDLDNK